jgi:hypothetical protein
MQLLGDHQRLPNKQRTKIEKSFKWINSIVMAVQFACFLIDLSRISIAAPKTFEEGDIIWVRRSFALDQIIATKTATCYNETGGYNFTGNVWGYSNVPLQLNSLTQNMLFAELSELMRFAVIVNAAALVVGFFNKFMYDANVYEWRWKQLFIHKDVVTFVEIILLCVSIQRCAACDVIAPILREWLQACGVHSENSLPYVAPLIAMYVANGFTLLMHLVTLLILLKNSLGDKPPEPTAPA